MEVPKLGNGKKGEKVTPNRVLDMATRPLLNEMIAEKASWCSRRGPSAPAWFLRNI
jgi:hypothetical protein